MQGSDRERRRGAARGRPCPQALLSLGFLPAGGSAARTRAPAAAPAPSAKPELTDTVPPRGPGNRRPLPPTRAQREPPLPPPPTSGSPPPAPAAPPPPPPSRRARGGGPGMEETPLQTGPARPARRGASPPGPRLRSRA